MQDNDTVGSPDFAMDWKDELRVSAVAIHEKKKNKQTCKPGSVSGFATESSSFIYATYPPGLDGQSS